MPAAGSFNPTLNDTALGYLALGWSVIPLYGDANPERPKVAAVPWEPYQRRRARDTEVTAWFQRPDVGALGIVTGAVSQLVILDFDELALLQAFERACPELVATRTVLTRRGRHLYFHLPPQLVVRSRKLDGLDLLAGGRYAVAPPSVIDGHNYAVGRGGRPKTLTQRDLDRLDAFLDSTRFESPTAPSGVILAPPRVDTQEGPLAREIQPLLSDATPTVTPSRALLSADDLIRLYRGLAYQSKRNVALFKASCLARDHGWSYAAVVETLADIHAAQPARGQHRAEKETSRYREAIATIRSVFSRPARPRSVADVGGLYNSIRERLFRLGQTCVVRVLEGLRLAGFKTRQLVTESEVLHALRGLVGRHSVRRALQACSPNGEEIFSRISPRHPPRRSAAADIRVVNTPNADVCRTSPNKNRGRPTTTFRIPSLEALCQRLGVQPSGSDPLTFEDLQSARKTRQAAHRELIRRRPGLYLRQWLADRLGVSGVTIWRYNQQDDALHATPTYTATPLRWGNLNAIPADDTVTSGTFLEDERGKRWPALKGIATRLLGQGRRVRLLVQTLSYYWCGSGDPLALGLQVERAVDIKPIGHVLMFAQRVERLIRQIAPAPAQVSATENRSQVPEQPVNRQRPVSDYEKKPVATVKSRRRRYWRALDRPDDERLAQRVYTVVNARTSEAKHKLSLVTARKWVDEYGAALVGRALDALQGRRDVQQPAGWLKVWLRSGAKKSVHTNA